MKKVSVGILIVLVLLVITSTVAWALCPQPIWTKICPTTNVEVEIVYPPGQEPYAFVKCFPPRPPTPVPTAGTGIAH